MLAMMRLLQTMKIHSHSQAPIRNQRFRWLFRTGSIHYPL